MGDSKPPPASIDLVDSYARRRGSDVELVLRAPSVGQDATSAQLRRLGVAVDGTAELVTDDRGPQLIVRLPRAAIGDGRWPVFIRTPAGDEHRVQARLLVQGDRPLVLLWGARGADSEVPRTPTARTRAVRAGSRALDVALRPVPAEQAVAIRDRVYRTARSLLR